MAQTLGEFLVEIEKEDQIISGVPVKFVDPKLIPKAARIIQEMKEALEGILKENKTYPHILKVEAITWLPRKAFENIDKILNDEEV